MARIPVATRDTVPSHQAVVFDELFANGEAPHYGPGSVLAHVPELSKRNTALNNYLAMIRHSRKERKNSR